MWAVQPSGAQGQQQQLLVPGGFSSQFTVVPATQTDPTQLSTKPVRCLVSSLSHSASCMTCTDSILAAALSCFRCLNKYGGKHVMCQ